MARGTKHSKKAASDAEQIVQMAWDNLPPAHRNLLESIGASQWQVVSQPLGSTTDAFMRSAGFQVSRNPLRQQEMQLWLSGSKNFVSS